MPTFTKRQDHSYTAFINDTPSSFTALVEKQQALYREIAARKNLEPAIRVSDAVRSLAGLYERTRNTLEYHDTDIVRRIAIERTLKRLMLFSGGEGLGALPQAETLVKELIRSGYFPNDIVPESTVHEVAKILDRFGRIQALGLSQDEERLARSLAATEIEEAVLPDERLTEEQFAYFALETFRERLMWPEELAQNPRHITMLYLAIWRTIVKADEARTVAAVVHQAFPSWRNMSGDEAQALAADVVRSFRALRLLLRTPKLAFYRKMIRPYAPSLEALRDVCGRHKDDLFELANSPILLEEALDQSIQDRFRTTRRELRWSALRATMYVFMTKMVVALAVELPADALLNSFSPKPFVMNLLGPPALMAFVAFSARVPGEKVSTKILEDAMCIATESVPLVHPRRKVTVRGHAKSVWLGSAALLLVGIAYLVTAKLLAALGFSLFAGIVFVLFLSLVSVFAYRIRRPVRELNVLPLREGFVSIIIDLVTFPFLALGKILSEILEGVNVFLFLLDIFIESPLKSLLSFLEEWLQFLREKREEFVGEV